ncbi:MAG: hypothetical protein KGJ24_13865, partial [Burkholderiales bacterium]|nr:hypothetical protein [Burkholderiales bacterium]
MTWRRLRGPEPGASLAGRAATAALLAFVLLASGCANLARPPGDDAAAIAAAAPAAPAAPAASTPALASAASAPEAAASAARLVAAPGDATADAGAGEATGVRPLTGRLDPEQDSGRTDLWQRVREG